jgi:succinate dehydrogenase/fumarate reductase cytochrome b subunit
MRLPTLKPLGISAPFRSAPLFRTLGPGSVSSLLKIALDVAYVLLMIIRAVLLLAFLAAGFHHTASGLQVVLEDYVNQHWLRTGLILAVKGVCALLWLTASLAVLRIAT